ncbi:hypothetical protein K440DRAFT_580147 [Wilcoxina mikolae CBS 423.85]|nr:hypothetical protein K440DRAFT_580147 [Wilcoxina mikolae CBS 423.85]
MAQDQGSYSVPGLSWQKQQVLNNGGNSLDLAIAMLETDDMTTNYPYGDNKSDDSANFGIFKQNWFMLRNACSYFYGQSTAQWGNGVSLNNNIWMDIDCCHQSQDHYGYHVWFAGHRNGETGVNNPYTADIDRYKEGVQWIQQQIDSDSRYLTDDTRFWVSIPAI